MIRWGRAAIASAFLALAAALVVVAVAVHDQSEPRDGDELPGGPLVTSTTMVRYTATNALQRRGYAIGEEFSDGLLNYIEFDTVDPVTITSIEPVSVDSALKYLGAVVVPTPRHGFPYAGFDTAPGFPILDRPIQDRGVVSPRMWEALSHPEPAVGATLSPAMWAGKLVNRPMLLLGWERVDSGPASTEGVRIEYQVDGRDYARTITRELVYCPSRRSSVQNTCTRGS